MLLFDDSVSFHVSADCGSGRAVRSGPASSVSTIHSGSLVFSYTIFTLPFTVWVLTTFMRDLPVEIEEAAIVDGATPLGHHHQSFPAIDVAGNGNDRTACLHRGVERVSVSRSPFTSSTETRTVPVTIALLSRLQARMKSRGASIMAASVIVTVPLVVLVLIFQRKIISGLTAGGVKG